MQGEVNKERKKETRGGRKKGEWGRKIRAEKETRGEKGKGKSSKKKFLTANTDDTGDL